MDNDCLEAHEDVDLGTVVLADKGKGVDPGEYGHALYDPNSMIAPVGTTSAGGSDTIEVVGTRQDKGKNIDPEERGNETAKYEPGPSRIDFRVDPREDGGALRLYDSNLMIVPAGTTSTSTGGSDSIKLIGVNWDKGKNIDPEERGTEMAKYEPGPSQIDFYDHGTISFQKQGIPLQSFEPTKTTNLNDGLPHNPTLPRPSWFPKISPYRFMVLSIPLAIGTVKAALSLKGSATTPTTLEWISGIVIYLLWVVFNN